MAFKVHRIGRAIVRGEDVVTPAMIGRLTLKEFIPPGFLARLAELRVPTSDYVFAGFPDELRQFYRACPQKQHFADKIKSFTPRKRPLRC